VPTETTMVPSGMPRRSALPENFARQVSRGSAGSEGMGPSLAAAGSQKALPKAAHVQA